ncbi:PAS domain-containing sensor histidine kinase [Thiocystis violacea]|uniref:PAS domain-containing sensor histidine kinase n=1 Tax=Thiocystis violacea TaxID=13725 RepID=UPI00190609F6|nr:ATP-binding protein [Thiocystis violacea]MBK1722714.1 PAS domain-containing sensor histidine kinase [Thiocystis violacea]
MPWVAIVVGLAAGTAIWTLLDQIQSRQVDKIFEQELEVQLDLRARESLIRFDRYLASYGATTRLLANHRKLSEYLEPLFWSADETVTPIVYKDFRPTWLPDFFERDALTAPSQVLLTDPQGRVREIFQPGAEPAPTEVATQVPSQFVDERDVRTVVERLDERLYLLISDAVEDAGGYDMGYLVVLVPVDDAFLAASQRGLNVGRAAVALVDSADQRIVASVDSRALMPDSILSDWSDTYVITSQSLPEYEGSDSNLLFTTFVPLTSVEKMSRHVRILERRQRFIAAGVFVSVFTAVIYLVSSRLNKVLKRMTRFSQRALGIAEPGFDRGGNQLVLLEDWIQHFTQLVLTAREEMSRKHQAEMRESEALKAAMMEASLDAIVTLDHRGRVIEYNPAAERLFGVGRPFAIGAIFTERFLPDVTRAAFKRLLDRSRHLHREPLGRGELIALRADGSEVPVEISIAPIDLVDERFYTLYIHDISSRKRAEQEIKSLARFASESPNPILRVTDAGLIVYANSASRPLLRAWDADPGESLPPEWGAEVAIAAQTSRPLERELDVSGQVYSLLLAPIRDLGYVNIYARDITAVRRAEQESRQHQAELVHVCRLSTMGEVATGMAHELNQPLSAIVNYANGCTRRLQSGVGEPEALIGAMNQITAQAKRASEIIRRLRALVGKQPPTRSQADLNHLVREVCSFLEFETHRLGMQIELELADTEIPICVDLVQVEQVLLNLVGNALDALEAMPEGERRLRIRTARVGAVAEVMVGDNGPGIEAERISGLFDPFVTTKDKGMGMGLAISQTIAENHDGRIWAESELGVGSAFYMTLPLSETAKDAEVGATESLETLG